MSLTISGTRAGAAFALAMLLTATLATPALAQSESARGDSTQSDNEALDELLGALHGDDYHIDRTASATEDPAGDVTTYGGDPADAPIEVLLADWVLIEGASAESIDEFIFEYCDNPADVERVLEAVCPLDRALFQASNDFLLAYALVGGVVDPDAFQQFVFAWAEPALAPYEGAPFDPNTGRNKSKDLYKTGDGAFALGETVYDGSFSFDAANGGVMALFGRDMIALLMPRRQFAEQCLNVAIALVAQSGVIDLASLPDQPNGVVTSMPPEPPPPEEPAEEPATDEPPVEVSDGPTAVVVDPPVDEPSVDATPAPVAADSDADATDDDGGSALVLVLIAIAVLVVIGLAVAFGRRSRPAAKSDCEEERRASDAAHARWQQAVDNKGAAERRLTHTQGVLSPLRVELENLDAMAPRPGEYADPADYDNARAAHDARAVDLRHRFDEAQAANSEAERAYRDAIADEQAAYEAYRAAWNAYQDCLGAGLAAVHQPPPGAESRTVGAGETAPPGVTTGAGTGSTGTGATTGGCEPGAAEWRHDGDSPTRWVLADEATIRVSRGTVAFQQWLETNGTLESGDGNGEETTGTFDIVNLDAFANRAGATLFARPEREYLVDIEILIHAVEQYATCERYWECDSTGTWVPTELTRVGARVPVDEKTVRFADADMPTPERIGQMLEWALTRRNDMHNEANDIVAFENECQSGG